MARAFHRCHAAAAATTTNSSGPTFVLHVDVDKVKAGCHGGWQGLLILRDLRGAEQVDHLQAGGRGAVCGAVQCGHIRCCTWPLFRAGCSAG